MAAAEGSSYQNLEKTKRHYKGVFAKGKDIEDGRAKILQIIGTAAYYAFECEPQIYTSYSGLEINKKAQVLNEAGVPIKGLYAAGDVTGHLAYQSGLGGGGISGLVMATVYGKIAGEEAAKN